MFLFFALCALAVLAFVIRAFQGVDELRDNSDSSPSDIYAEKQGILHLLQNKRFLLVGGAFGLALGSVYAVSTEIQSIFGSFIDDDDMVGWLGFVMVAAGVFGVVASGAVATKMPGSPGDLEQGSQRRHLSRTFIHYDCSVLRKHCLHLSRNWCFWFFRDRDEYKLAGGRD